MAEETRKKECKELIRRIGRGEVILFVGAGYSMAAGGPSGKALKDNLVEQFPDVDAVSEDLLDVCQGIEESHGQQALVRAVRRKLSKLVAKDCHIELTSYHWPVIFTTNYDRVIESAYQQNPKSAHLRVKHRTTPSVIQPYISETFLFKLMGDVDSENEEESMILTRSDYNLNLGYRIRILEFLKELLADCTFLYIGYSFRDLLVTDRYRLIPTVFPKNKLPYGYALMPDVEYGSREDRKLAANHITPLKMGLEGFVEKLKNQGEQRRYEQDEASESFRIRDNTIVLSGTKMRLFAESYELVSTTSIENAKPIELREFFGGR